MLWTVANWKFSIGIRCLTKLHNYLINLKKKIILYFYCFKIFFLNNFKIMKINVSYQINMHYYELHIIYCLWVPYL